jgi:RNA polymerase sigma-70 factor (ECF subfamily)
MEDGLVESLAKLMEQMMNEHQKEIFRYACTLTKDRDEAEELVQQAFYQTLIYLQNNPDEKIRDPKGWLRTAVHNHFLNAMRYRHRFVDTDGFRHPSSDPETEEDELLAIPDHNDESRPEYVIESQEEEQEIRKKIAETFRHPNMQKVMEHFIIDRMSCTDIAEICRTPLSTVRYQVKKGVAALKLRFFHSKQREG